MLDVGSQAFYRHLNPAFDCITLLCHLLFRSPSLFICCRCRLWTVNFSHFKLLLWNH